MLQFLRLLTVNPITKWLQWILLRNKLLKKFKTLSLGYMSIVHNSSFSIENHIFPNATIINSHLGNLSYVGGKTIIKNTIVGHFCSIASDCKIGLGIHPTNLVSSHPAFYSPKNEWSIYPNLNYKIEEYKQINIGNDVWIGTNAIIIDGVSIGNGAIIAANAVVTKDVPPYAIVGGVPAKIIKYRFDEFEIEKLESIKWWNWDLEKIKNNINNFNDVKSFLNEY